MDIVQKLKLRSLSEEYYSRSPNSQCIIRAMAAATPTSKYKKEYTNVDKYNDPNTTNEERQFMLKYGLIDINKLKSSKS
jgi:hypothetical protein